MKIKSFFGLLMVSTLMLSANVFASEVSVENTTVQSSVEIDSRIFVDGNYYVSTSAWTEVCWEPNNLLKANVNITNGNYVGDLRYKIIDSNGKVYTGRVNADSVTTHKGIPSGGYTVYVQAIDIAGNYAVSVDDWII